MSACLPARSGNSQPDRGRPGLRWPRGLIEQLLHGDHHPGDRLRQLDLAALAEEIAAAERLVHDGEIDFTRPREPVLTWSDPMDIRRIIVNLLENATRAAGSSGKVQIDVRNEQETGTADHR